MGLFMLKFVVNCAHFRRISSVIAFHNKRRFGQKPRFRAFFALNKNKPWLCINALLDESEPLRLNPFFSHETDYVCEPFGSVAKTQPPATF